MFREDALKQLVLKQLQQSLSYLQQFERVFIRQQIDATLAERRYELSAKQKQLKQEIEALTAEGSEADTEATNVAKLIAVTKQYTRIDELTPEVLNAFVDKIVVHEREKKDGKRTQKIDICYSYVGIMDIPMDEEMQEMERGYMQRTKRQTA